MFSFISKSLRSIGRKLGFDAEYVVQNAAWLNARLVFGTLLSLVLAIAFANLFTPDQYGQYKYVIAAVTFWGGLFLAGANVAITGAVARGAERTFLASIPLQLKWDIGGALCIAATGLYYILHGNHAIGVAILASGPLYLFASVFNTYAAYFAGKRDFRQQALYESFASGTYFVVIISGLLLGAQPALLAVLFFLSGALGHLVGFRRAGRLVDRSTPVEADTLSYAKQLTLVSIPASLMFQLDNILVFHYLGSVELAIYTFAMLGPDKIASMLKFLPAIALPKYAQRTTSELRSSVLRHSLQFSAIGACIGLAYALAAPLAFKLLFPQYLAAVRVTQFYALSLVAVGATLPMYSLMAQARIKRIAIMQFGLPMLQLVATFIGIRYFGLMGAITAKIGGDFVGFALGAFLHQYQRTPEAEDSSIV